MEKRLSAVPSDSTQPKRKSSSRISRGWNNSSGGANYDDLLKEVSAIPTIAPMNRLSSFSGMPLKRGVSKVATRIEIQSTDNGKGTTIHFFLAEKKKPKTRRFDISNSAAETSKYYYDSVQPQKSNSISSENVVLEKRKQKDNLNSLVSKTSPMYSEKVVDDVDAILEEALGSDIGKKMF